LILVEYRHDAVNARLVIDDDGKACYAYLYINDKISADVWLYNVQPSPPGEWDDLNNMPFANTNDCIVAEMFEPLKNADEIALSWKVEEGKLRQVAICLRGRHHALLCPGSRPGWCRLARRANPVAQPLRIVQ
jgi:hypothetical protein